MQLDRVGRAAAVVRVDADVEAQTGRQVADRERRPVGRHVAGQRLPVPVVHLHDEPLVEAAVETGLAPDHQRRSRLVNHRTVLQAIRPSCAMGEKKRTKIKKQIVKKPVFDS